MVLIRSLTSKISLRGLGNVRSVSMLGAGSPILKKATGAASMMRRYVNTNSGTDRSDRQLKAILTLEDGSVFEGISFGAEKAINGEVVFSTGMVGYTESLTDPSYRGQMLTLTFPMVGNYGVPSDTIIDKHGLLAAFESDRIHASALIVQDYSYTYSHWDAKMSLSQWLKQEGIPGIHGIDTRMLTKKIRSKGSMLGKIEFAEHKIEMADPNTRNLVAEVSTKEVKYYGKGNPIKILAVDCGMKYNIIRMLVNRGAEVKLVPWDYNLYDDLANCDGVFISNGPGDPTMCEKTISELTKVINAKGDLLKPVFGICLGNQLLALAAGAKTEKLPFGNRGQNQPVLNTETGECYITPQNHGYAVMDASLPAGWRTLFTNANDGTNEGIVHTDKPFFTAQFHPEANGGPTDTAFLFDVFLDAVRNKTQKLDFKHTRKPKPHCAEFKKVLLLGSGGLSIGQAGEFDYSGSQAIKALKEGGLEVILMNPNIASVQTNVGSGDGKADQVFFLPVTAEYVEEILKRERPDGILISMGGQTALNCGVELYNSGILEKYGVRVMGTPVETVIATEDREIFNQKLGEIGEKIAQSKTANTIEQAKVVAKEIGYPVMIRAAYALGGLGSGICNTEAILVEKSQIALALSPQILVEKSLLGWKELEYEVVRDAADNCITVCNMENFDPLGVHTGDSIVIAPSQTLSNREYHMLRDTAIKLVRHLGVVGECNIQYALNPNSEEYCIIEVNARLSRSSALASKATGYPLAYVATKLCLGKDLVSIRNSINKTTTACFEPSLDYCVVKVPRWDLSKFNKVSCKLGSSMTSVGEVMAIGRTFEEAIQKAARMVSGGAAEGLDGELAAGSDLETMLRVPTDKRLYAVQYALEKGYSIDEINRISNIDRWFLARLKIIADMKAECLALSSFDRIPAPGLRALKVAGFSDRQIARYSGSTEMVVRRRRQQLGITPFVKQIDTLAAEFPAQTNYLYMTYNGSEHDVQPDNDRGGVMVLGCGAYCIGSSVEFDWCAVSAVRQVRASGDKAIVVNYNPETVST
eukprot:CAMPEP_0173264630 /NCGR_PEP_ID=MMETSP1142-20121109/28082_1 /TAXON_ID=483371 /ORGANISM="non described non described, Strain CCMP2298" /LENGTH=1039 /DNA_ID=CAMNT_0014200191 /DNA_START=109 /DNA_END=3224 /DNA_ORIENTATION=+